MGAVTQTPVPGDGTVSVDSSFGSYREKGRHVQIGISLNASYATGGDTLDLSGFFPVAVYRVILSQRNPTSSVTTQPSKYLAAYVPGTTNANGTVKVIDSTSGSEVSSTTDLHTYNYLVDAWGE